MRPSLLIPSLGVAAAVLFTAPAQAQLGSLVKKKLGVPTVQPAQQISSAQPAAASKRPAGEEITAQVLDQFLAGLRAEKAAKDQAASQAKAQQAQADADRQAAEQGAEARLQKYQACMTDKRDSNPRSAKLKQLRDAASKAEDRGDEKTAKDLNVQAAMLDGQISALAQGACNDLFTEYANYRAPASTTTAQPDVATSGRAMKNASPRAEVAGAQAGGFTPSRYGQLKEQVLGFLYYPRLNPMTAQEQKAFDPRRADLEAALKAIGA